MTCFFDVYYFLYMCLFHQRFSLFLFILVSLFQMYSSLFSFFFFRMAPHISYFTLNRRDTNTIAMHDPQASRTTRDASRSCQCPEYRAILLQSCHADVTLTIRLSCRMDSPLSYRAKNQEELT